MEFIKEWWKLIICIFAFSIGSAIMNFSEEDTIGRKIGGTVVLSAFIIPVYYAFIKLKEKK